MGKNGERVPEVPAGLTIDLWYTLIYQTPGDRRKYEQARRDAWAQALREAGVHPDRLHSFMVRHAEKVRRIEEQGRAWPLDRQAEWASRLLRRTVDTTSLRNALDDALAGASIRLAAGALEALDEVIEAEIPFVVVSNVIHESPDATRSLLERLELSSRASACILSSEFGHSKPSPLPILEGLWALGCLPVRAMHIGDLPSDRGAAWDARVAAVRFTGLKRWAPLPRVHRPNEDRWGVPEMGRWAGFRGRLPDLFARARDALAAHRSLPSAPPWPT
ncbi:MAG: HAD hydrolase-like protein [Thermoplasmata archaeon]|nr:HAD hydrolase-like protein [Thermoplasmata archaeon]